VVGMKTRRFLLLSSLVAATAIVGAVVTTFVVDKRAAKRHRMHGVSRAAKVR